MADMYLQPIKHWTKCHRRSNKSKAIRDGLVAIFLCYSVMCGTQPEWCPCVLQR